MGNILIFYNGYIINFLYIYFFRILSNHSRIYCVKLQIISYHCFHRSFTVIVYFSFTREKFNDFSIFYGIMVICGGVGMRILLIEDEIRMAQALCEILRLEKYEVDHYANGFDGLAAIKSDIYDS